MTKKEALSKAIMTHIYFQAHFCKSKEAVDNTQAIIDTLEEIEQEPEWIPVSERLPEENGYYLTTTMYGDVYCDYWAEIGFDRQETIIAWQPLPEPYKAESEDKE